MAQLPKEFVQWEQAAPAIDFKTAYVDMAGDLIAGLMLSQIVWSYLPTTKRSLISKKGDLWVIKGEQEWWDECRLSKKRAHSGIKKLKRLGIIKTKVWPHYGRKNITHISLNVEQFVATWQGLAPGLSDVAQKVLSDAPQKVLSDAPQKALSNRDVRDKRETLGDDDVFFALTAFNDKLKTNGRKPLTALPFLVAKIVQRGESVSDMRQAWQTCKKNAKNPIGAFVRWINHGYLPIGDQPK